MTVQAGLCLTWSETRLLVFSCEGSDTNDRYDQQCGGINQSLFSALFHHPVGHCLKLHVMYVHRLFCYSIDHAGDTSVMSTMSETVVTETSHVTVETTHTSETSTVSAGGGNNLHNFYRS